MRTSIIGAAAIALLSSTALVSAQQGPGGGQPAMKEQGATPGSSSGGAERSQSGNQSAPERKEQPRAQAPEDKGAGAKSDRSGDMKRSAEPKDKAGDTKRRAEDKAGDTKRSAEPKDKAGDRDRAAESKDKAGDRNRAADKERMDRDRSKDSARGKDQDRQPRDQAQTKGDQRDGARVTLSQDQRTQVRERLNSHREARVTNVSFSINIGATVPRNFRAVHVIPSDIVAIVPQYRGYRYFIYEERVVIVHPQRYEIVEVIEVNGPRRGGAVTAILSLTPPQRTLIVERIPRNHVARGVSIDLALGAELPSSVELYEFPDAILVEVPSLKPYRYVVLERRVAVIDPSNRAVVEVLDR